MKPWDLIGGVIEGKESPLMALSREVQQESTLRLDVNRLHYIGVMRDSSSGTDWSSHVFLTHIEDHVQMPERNWKKVTSPNMENCQPWLRRHWTFMEEECGPLSNWKAQCVVRQEALVACDYDPKYIKTMSKVYLSKLLAKLKIVFPCYYDVVLFAFSKCEYPCAIRPLLIAHSLVNNSGVLEVKRDDRDLISKLRLYLTTRRSRPEVALWAEHQGFTTDEVFPLLQKYKMAGSHLYFCKDD